MTSFIKTIIKFLSSKDYRFRYLSSLGLFNNLSDEIYLQKKFKATVGYDLNLISPKTFNEKLQWLKLYDRQPEYVLMVDKQAVKEYVLSKIGEEYIIPTLGVWDRFDDIEFSSLPNQFVLKCTHDSGGLVICKEKLHFDKRAAKKKINRCLKCNYYYRGREWPYKGVKPRIICEKYMTNNGSDLMDYKLMCFNGKVRCTFVCSNRSTALNVTFFDNHWHRLPFIRHYPASTYEIPKPHHFETMIELAEKLSAGIPFVRVDFYEIDGKIYFGELTFYPGSGFEEFEPEEWDKILGDWITLPEKK